MLDSLMRSPLVRFLFVGLVLFGLVQGLGAFDADGGTDADRIVVERRALLDFVQLRTGEADARVLEARWDRLDPEVRQVWIDRFVREEALVREARSLGLDRNDDLIRRRLVQNVEFLIVTDVDGSIDAATYQAAYEARAEDHRSPVVATFRHVFVDDAEALSLGASARAYGRAADLRDALNGDGVVFEGAGDRGDRFLYNRVYVDRTLDEVRAHFGDEMAGALDALEPHASEWQGPLASQHGWHAVLLTRKAPSRIPALAEIRSVLREEILRERREASLERGVREVLDRYAPQLADDVHAPPEPDAG